MCKLCDRGGEKSAVSSLPICYYQYIFIIIIILLYIEVRELIQERGFI